MEKQLTVKNEELGRKCPKCKSRNTTQMGSGGYQSADAARGLPEIDTDGQFHCNDCKNEWWD